MQNSNPMTEEEWIRTHSMEQLNQLNAMERGQDSTTWSTNALHSATNGVLVVASVTALNHPDWWIILVSLGILGSFISAAWFLIILRAHRYEDEWLFRARWLQGKLPIPSECAVWQAPDSEFRPKCRELQGISSFNVLIVLISGFYSTEIPDADERLGLDRPYGLNVYEQFWIMYSPLQELIPKDEYGYPTWGYSMHRRRIIRGLDSLAEVSAESGPKFVFAHILAAHPPFVLREDGTPVPEYRPYLVSDGDSAYASRDEYVSGYAGQVAYINQSLLEILPVILHNSQRPAIIILQGDHGLRSTKIRSGAEDSCLWERASIFNAYYLPEEYRAALYPAITPVNTFRFVFREIFHVDYPPLEDKTYYSTWAAPYRMTDIGDRIAGPCAG